MATLKLPGLFSHDTLGKEDLSKVAYVYGQFPVLTCAGAICLGHLPLAAHFLDAAMIHLLQAQQQRFLNVRRSS